MKKIIVLLASLVLCLSCAFCSYSDSFVNSGPGAARWEGQSDGRWKYKMGDKYVTDKWVDSDGQTYLLDSNGYMLT